MEMNERSKIRIDLLDLTGKRHRKALALRPELGERILKTYLGGEPSGVSDTSEPGSRLGSWIREHSGDTACITLLAGAGSRWIKSLEAAGKNVEFRLDAPRGLYPVKNYLDMPGNEVPMASYALAATEGIGKHIIVIRGWKNEISKNILVPLGISPESVEFKNQVEGPSGKVLGHGDAVWQCMDAWKEARYVVTNFGGDANSPLTLITSVLAMKALKEIGAQPDLLLPVTWMKNPVYRISLDRNGLPKAFGHDKLGGIGVAQKGKIFAYANVGVRIYRADALREALEAMRKAFWKQGMGYSIPGNDPEGHEFALDNVDAYMAAHGRARIFGIAHSWEITPAKSFDELRNFENAVKKVSAEWKRVRKPAR
jgi:hypothetical protein